MQITSMPMTWDINAATLLLLVTNFIGLIWFAFVTASSARAALREARAAHDRLSVLTAAFASYREQIAKEYISRDIMREVEDRMTNAIENLARISAEAIDRLGTRLDRAFEVRRHDERV